MRMKMRTINKRGLLSFLLTLIMIIGVLPLSAPTVSAEDDTVEVSTWEELKRALEYTTNCSVVKVVADIETKGLNGHTGLHQDNIIFMTMAMDKVLELNANHPVFAVLKAAQEAGDTDKINKYSALLYAQAQLIEGLPVDDPTAYAEAVCSLMK